MDEPDSNVRRFPGAEIPEQTLFTERPPFTVCGHEKITLDSHNRTVKCAGCGKVFDPFHFLQNEVERIQSAWVRHKEVRTSVSELVDRVDALKKEEARLKGRIRTAKAKVEPVIDLRNRNL